MKVQLSKYAEERPFKQDIDGNFLFKNLLRRFLSMIVYVRNWSIIESQIITDNNTSTIRLHNISETHKYKLWIKNIWRIR